MAAARTLPGWMMWVRTNLFSSVWNSILTVLAVLLLARILPPLVNWGIVDAVWHGDAAACRAAGGACWALITEKYRLILFGLYPFDQQWRPLVAMILLIGMMVVSAIPGNWRSWLIWMWPAGLAIVGVLMWGGIFGLASVSDDKWGGLPLTMLLALAGIVFSFPLAVLLALGRRSSLPGIRVWCVAYIEIWRGVPLVNVLFMASILFPLFLPEGFDIDKLLRAQIAIILFNAAYNAESMRGGLQALAKGQYEAADSLGLSYWQKMRLIILPQSLRLVIPPLVGQFITTFKDTSLVAIIGLYDLLSSTRLALNDPEWHAFYIEAYLTAAMIYFVFTFAMSRYSQYLERRFRKGTRVK
jgi:general L-amino acid transport system permease protein